MHSLAYLIGAGSMSLGVERAGFQLEHLYETPGYGKNAQTWTLNRPEVPVNILELDHTSTFFRQHQGLDLIYGNPPCGGLSSMTCSRMESPTNLCMRQWIRMVVQAKPRMILMENAYQLATERVKPLLQDLTDVLDSHDYYWWTWMFYSYQVGTPQIRRRMFLCATLDRPRRSDLFGLDDLPRAGDKTRCPCGVFLDDLIGVRPSSQDVINTRGEAITQHGYDRMDYYTELNRLVGVHRQRLSEPHVAMRLLEKTRLKAAEGNPLSISQLPNYEKWAWPDMPKQFDGMSMTRPQIIHFDRAAPAMVGFFKFVHPLDDRVLTMREMARLMGYPDSWQFHKLRPHLLAQGVPANSTMWATKRMLAVIGQDK
jgi:DNA (cytosine-5)-methyltransferase 1